MGFVGGTYGGPYKALVLELLSVLPALKGAPGDPYVSLKMSDVGRNDVAF